MEVQQPLGIKSYLVKRNSLALQVIGSPFKAWGIISSVLFKWYFIFIHGRKLSKMSSLLIILNLRDASHSGTCSSSVSQPYITTSSSTHQQQQYEHDRKRRKSGLSTSSTSLHRRGNSNNFSSTSRNSNDVTPEHLVNPCRGTKIRS